MHDLFINIAIYLSICCSSPLTARVEIPHDASLSSERVENVAIASYRSKTEGSILQNDAESINEGLDSLFEVLGSSRYLHQKAEVAQFIVGLITGDLFFRYEKGIADYDPIKEMLTSVLKNQQRKCFRIGQLLKATDGRLLQVVGNEDSGIARATHLRCIYLGDLMLRDNPDNSIEDYWSSNYLNKTDLMIDFYTTNCSANR